MTRSTLPVALDLMFGHEGGYVNVKTDAGGPTKYGITHKTLAAHRGVASVSAADVKALTLKEATDIYVRSYWGQSGGDLLPVGLDYMAFDFGVNSGPPRAVRTLQITLRDAGVYKGAIDGHAGEGTMRGVATYPGGLEKLMRDYADARISFLKSLGGTQGWKANGRGWTIRVTGKDPLGKWKAQPGVLGNALRLAHGVNTDAVSAPAEVNINAKADAKNISIVEIVKKPEAWGPISGAAAASASLLSGSPILQYAVAAVVVIGACVGVWYFVRRVRERG